MKSKIDKLGSAKRFGSRYGTKPKHKFAKIEKEQRKKHRCPYCNNVQVKRIVVGIWHCKKCNSKFTGRAYTISAMTDLKKTDTSKEAEISVVETKGPEQKTEEEVA